MKSSIYVSAEQIQVIGYEGHSVKKFVVEPLPEGTMYSGTITDGTLLKESLDALSRSNPGLFRGNVTLIVDGTSILSRRLSTPRLSHKQYLQLVRDEFADSIDDPNNLVCGYRKLTTAQNAILAVAVKKDLIDGYLSAFKEAGIKLSGIHVGVDVLINSVKSKPELQSSTVVLNVIDGPTMLSMLFVNGDNIFMSRTRLYGEDAEQINSAILSNLSGLIQFAQSEKHEEITASYYLGLSDENIASLAERNPYEGIRLDALNVYKGKVELPPEAHFACLNMRAADGIDLLSARKELDKHIKSKKPTKVWIPLLILYVLILTSAAGYLVFELLASELRITAINAFLHDPNVVAQRQELETLERKTSMLGDIEAQVESKAAWQAAMPAAVTPMLDFVIFGHGLNVDVQNFNFNEETGIVRIDASTLDQEHSFNYVDALYDSGLVQQVVYRGFDSRDDVFTFTVDIHLYVEEPEEEGAE